MTLDEFIGAFNSYAASIKAPYRIEEVIRRNDERAILKCTGTACILCKTEADVRSCQVVSYMFSKCAKDGLAVFCILLDIFTKCGPNVRNLWLERLGHFDRSIDLIGRRTSTGKYELSVRPDNPTKGLISWFIKKL